MRLIDKEMDDLSKQDNRVFSHEQEAIIGKMKAPGYEAGDVCNRDGCQGIIDEHEADGSCTCFIHPPCSYCVKSRAFCDDCGWEGSDE